MALCVSEARKFFLQDKVDRQELENRHHCVCEELLNDILSLKQKLIMKKILKIRAI